MPQTNNFRTYRPEIDGLRALAVVPVVLFHAGVGAIPGGFVGVDIFFVISGYLISGILLREITENRFSLVGFYERRIRRILPNLYAMLVLTTLVGAVILLPGDLNRYGQSVIATLGFSSNIYFWLRAGYFAAASEQSPLLHTWSLGVEEQYYLFFPLVLLLCHHSARWMLGVILLLLAASFAFSIWQVANWPSAAFYLPFARWWELMLGSLLATGRVPLPRSTRLRALFSAVGAIAIISAMVTYSAATPFPGLAALAPCLGTALIIHAEQGSLTPSGRLLASPPFRAIGLVSYSLYLWHWPVIVFARYALQRPLTPVEVLAVLVTTSILALAAYQYIEKPTRHIRLNLNRLVVATAAAAGVLASVALSFVVTHGIPARYPPAIRAVALADEHINPNRHDCDSPSLERIANGQVCVIGRSGVTPSFALVGDSFADALSPGVATAAQQAGVAGLVFTRGGCSALAGVGNSPECRAASDATYAAIARNPAIRSVLIIARWPTIVEGRRYGLFPQENIWVSDDFNAAPGVANNRRVITEGLVRTLAMLAPRRVTIVTGMPEQHVVVPQFATFRLLTGLPVPGLERSEYDRRQAATLRLFQQVVPAAGGHLLNLGPVMCDKAECPIIRNGTALYVDDNHPSRDYAEMLAPNFNRAIGS